MYGDTDVLPHLAEIAFLRERENEIVKELHKLDLDTYSPGTAVEALAPKNRYAFRIVHQLPVLDTLLLLSAVVELAPKIEGCRLPSNGIEAFSYRVLLDTKGGVFRSDRTYKDWLIAQAAAIQGNLKVRSVIATDISDFYARVNFHRLENLLDECAPSHGAARYVKKHIKVIRAKQSFGLPVGGSAARLLAELALNDTDKALQDQGLFSTRFVDDFRLFLKADDNYYDALAFLAEQLSINEGLALSAAKTSVYGRTEYLARLKELSTDIAQEAQGEALDMLVANLYFDDEPDLEQMEILENLNLLGFLQEEVGKDAIDMGRIKVIFRALKLTKPEEAVGFLNSNFHELVVFAREMTLLMQALESEYQGCFKDLTDTVIDAALHPPASSVQVIRNWLLELFVRGTVPIAPAGVKKLASLSLPLDQRQLFLIRSRVGDKNFFRKQKTAFSQHSPLGQTCLIWGASCLPKDEYKAWLAAVKPNYSVPLGHLFLKWVETEQASMIDKLAIGTVEHHE